MRIPNTLPAVGVLAAAFFLPGCGYPTSDYADGEEGEYEDTEYEYEEEEEEDDWLLDLLLGLAAGSSEGGGGGGGSGGGAVTTVRARADLVRGASPSDADARGAVVVAKRAWREGFVVRADRLDPGAPVELRVGDRFNAPISVAATSADGRGVASFAPSWLPAGARNLEELAGRRVEVCDGSGRVLLAGQVPALRGRGGNRRASRGYRDDGTGVRLRVTLASLRTVGRQVFRLDARGLQAGATVEFLVRGNEGAMAVAATGRADDRGRFSLRTDSREGDPLPGGFAFVGSFAGRPFEVRCGGAVAAADRLPPR